VSHVQKEKTLPPWFLSVCCRFYRRSCNVFSFLCSIVSSLLHWSLISLATRYRSISLCPHSLAMDRGATTLAVGMARWYVIRFYLGFRTVAECSRLESRRRRLHLHCMQERQVDDDAPGSAAARTSPRSPNLFVFFFFSRFSKTNTSSKKLVVAMYGAWKI
jgi:hypothetical protein